MTLLPHSVTHFLWEKQLLKLQPQSSGGFSMDMVSLSLGVTVGRQAALHLRLKTAKMHSTKTLNTARLCGGMPHVQSLRAQSDRTSSR
ncbi:hypothetical protein SKAU_G00296920 [Synaphobranchus kaupii]|uniref:Uncharacterized protein n=1 Tax=Synaphobranchus kaupii TaxID=118154 RepID=A0A9Q1EUY7_SYNKA|nr:hypothetical protein SKAU_G00296920 [Synaphobranchus kaupii]